MKNAMLSIKWMMNQINRFIYHRVFTWKMNLFTETHCERWTMNRFTETHVWKMKDDSVHLSPCIYALTAQFHGSVLWPDLTQNSAKRVLKSKTPRKQFCLRCTFPRFHTAGTQTFYQRKTWLRIIMKLLTRASRFKLLSRSFRSNQNCYSARRNIFEFHFRSQKCEQICEQN